MSKDIAATLGLTEKGLKLLAKAAAHPQGHANGKGFGHGSGAIRGALYPKGLIEDRRIKLDRPAQHREGYGTEFNQAFITQSGRDLVARARQMGF